MNLKFGYYPERRACLNPPRRIKRGRKVDLLAGLAQTYERLNSDEHCMSEVKDFQDKLDYLKKGHSE